METVTEYQKSELDKERDFIKNPKHHQHFAMAFNQATDIITNLVNFGDKKNTGATYKDRNWADIRDIAKERIKKSGELSNNFQPTTYLFLKDYLWSGLNNAGAGTPITGVDELIICETLFVLNNVRNYCSHYYHEPAALQVSDGLHGLLQELFDVAKARKMAEYKSKELWTDEMNTLNNDANYNLFIKEHNTYYLNRNGLIFFASLLLPASVINEHFSHVEGFKRKDSAKFEFKLAVYSTYAKRDGSSRLAFLYNPNIIKNAPDEAQQDIYKLCSMYDIIETVKRIPAYSVEAGLLQLPPPVINDNGDEEPVILKRNTPFLKFAVKFLMDYKNELGWQNVLWRNSKVLKDEEEKQPGKPKDDEPPFDGKIYTLERFDYINTASPLYKLYVNEEQVYAKIQSAGGLTNVIFDQRGIKNIIAALAGNFAKWQPGENEKGPAILQAVVNYVNEFNRLIAALKNNETVKQQDFSCIQFHHLNPKLVALVTGSQTGNKNLLQTYAGLIVKKATNAVDALSRMDKAAIAAQTKFVKNKWLLQCYNFLLNTGSKLKATKQNMQAYSQIDKLSIYHYTLDSGNKPLTQLIEQDVERLPQNIRMLLMQPVKIKVDNNSASPTPILDGLVHEVKEYMLAFWSNLLKCLYVEKLPQEWANSEAWQQNTANPYGVPVKYTIEMLEMLARKLSINNPSLTKDRVPVKEGKQQRNRKEELVAYFENQPVFIPASYISNLLVDDTEFDKKLKEGNKVTTQNGKLVIASRQSVSKAIRNNKLLTQFLNNSCYLDEQNKQLDSITLPDGINRKEYIQQLIKKSNEQKTTDALLCFMATYYHRQLLKAPLQGSINNFTVKPVAQKVGDVILNVPYRKIARLNYYTNQENIKNLAVLYFKGFKHIDYELVEQKLTENKKLARQVTELALLFDKHLYHKLKDANSLNFAAERPAKLNENMPYKESYKFINYRELITKSGITNQKIIQWRNKALHAKVPDAALGSFETAKTEMEKTMKANGCFLNRKKENFNRNNNHRR